MLPRTFAVGLLAGAFLVAGQRPHAQQEGLRTRAEASGYTETSSYDDVRRIVGALAALPTVHTTTFGQTEEGRELPLLVVSEPKVTTPEAARRLGRPIVLVQANIHAGEVEGKEATLILARRLADGDLKSLAKQLVILLAPIYNADGNERVDTRHRPEQNGPTGGVGTRENAKGLDLNRDYMKLESAESRALVGLMNTWDPHVVVDLHTTDGSYHGYHLTYAPALNPNADDRIVAFTRETLLPNVRKAVLDTHGFRTYYYGNFASEQTGSREQRRIDPRNPGDAVWRTFDHRPRFGNNYVGLRNRIAVLSEAYSYLDFESRVGVTTAFVEEVWRTCAKQAQKILLLTSQADRALTTRTKLSKPIDLGVDFRIQPSAEPVAILVGDVSELAHPETGLPMRQMTELAEPVRMREYGTFVATRIRPLPNGWVIPRGLAASPRMAAALDRLRWHGIETRTIETATQMDVDRFVVQGLTRSEREFQGHQEARLAVSMEAAALSLDAGSILIPANQRLARLAAYLLEPDSDDGLVTWGIIEDGLSVGQGYPVYRVR
ncbi:MAG TPA: M14 family metallopeptidase [Vicinamibacterales bacterium]|nr:M14 family metallopeptidase [Vicinamibacterales bacterium]